MTYMIYVNIMKILDMVYILQIKYLYIAILICILCNTSSSSSNENKVKAHSSLSSNCTYHYMTLDTAPEIYWINMEHSTIRRYVMQDRLDSMGVKHHRVAALSMDDIYLPKDVEENWSLLNQVKYTSTQMPPARSPGDNNEYSKYKAVISSLYGRRRKNRINEIGCTASHLLAMKQAIYSTTSSSKYALIVEDDVYFPFDINWDELVQSAPSDFVILQLFNSNKDTMQAFWNRYIRRRDMKSLWIERFPKQIAGIWSTCAYLIDRDQIRVFLESKILSMHDGWLDIKLIAGLAGSGSDCAPRGSICCPLVNETMHYSHDPLTGCVLAPQGFAADSFLYMMAKTYVIGIPIITNSREGNVSTFHQSHVESLHASAFELQRHYINAMLTNVIALPTFLHSPCIGPPTLLSEKVEVLKSATCFLTKASTLPPIYWINYNQSDVYIDDVNRNFASLGIHKDTVHRIPAVSKSDIYIPSKIVNNIESANSCIKIDDAEHVYTRPYKYLIQEMCTNQISIDGISTLLSHLIAVYAAVTSDSTYKYAIMMEDDVRFMYDLDFNEVASTVHDTFSILQLSSTNIGYISSKWKDYKSNKAYLWEKQHAMYTDNDPYSCSVYLIEKAAMKKAIENIMTYTGADGSNEWMYKFNITPHYRGDTPSLSKFLYSLTGDVHISTIPLFANGLDQQYNSMFKRNNYTTDMIEQYKQDLRQQHGYINMATDDMNTLPKYLTPACKKLIDRNAIQ